MERLGRDYALYRGGGELIPVDNPIETTIGGKPRVAYFSTNVINSDILINVSLSDYSNYKYVIVTTRDKTLNTIVYDSGFITQDTTAKGLAPNGLYVGIVIAKSNASASITIAEAEAIMDTIEIKENAL